MSDDNLIIEHYKKQAEKHGASPRSTMEDDIIREKEITFIQNFVGVARDQINETLQVMDLGCGNGYALDVVANTHLAGRYWGVDFTEDLLEIARARGLSNCTFSQGDARSLAFDDEFFHVVYSERCLINILDWEQQQQALTEIARVLKPGGYYLMIEAFLDGLTNNNKAREELGMHALDAAYHNLYFDKPQLFSFIEPLFEVVHPAAFHPANGETLFPSNFLSSHYFVARVLHPLITKGEWTRNTEIVKFFSWLPPQGDYSPIQAYILKKRG